MKLKTILFTILLITVLTPFVCIQLPLDSVHFMTVSGTSMEPVLTHNDIAVFKPALDQEVEVGDIISYTYCFENDETITIAHRIIDITDDGYKTKGDSLNQVDGYVVAEEDVLGVMWFKIPCVVKFGHFVHTLPGLFLVIIIPAVILILREVNKIVGG